MYGKHRVLGLVMVIPAIGTLIPPVASSLPLPLAGRILQGIGGGIFPLGFGIIRYEFPPARPRPLPRPRPRARSLETCVEIIALAVVGRSDAKGAA